MISKSTKTKRRHQRGMLSLLSLFTIVPYAEGGYTVQFWDMGTPIVKPDAYSVPGTVAYRLDQLAAKEDYRSQVRRIAILFAITRKFIGDAAPDWSFENLMRYKEVYLKMEKPQSYNFFEEKVFGKRRT